MEAKTVRGLAEFEQEYGPRSSALYDEVAEMFPARKPGVVMAFVKVCEALFDWLIAGPARRLVRAIRSRAL